MVGALNNIPPFLYKKPSRNFGSVSFLHGYVDIKILQRPFYAPLLLPPWKPLPLQQG